jgi:hypothetical protein
VPATACDFTPLGMLTAAEWRAGQRAVMEGGGSGEDGRRMDEREGESVVEDGREQAQTSSPKTRKGTVNLSLR